MLAASTASAAPQHAIGQMVEVAYPARCDDGHVDGSAHSPFEFKIEPDLGAIAVHTGQQDFTGPAAHHPLNPFDDVKPGRLTPTVGKNFPAQRLILSRHTLGVYRNNNAL